MKKCPECELTYLDSIDDCYRCKIQLVIVERNSWKNTKPFFIILIILIVVGISQTPRVIDNWNYREGVNLFEKGVEVRYRELYDSRKYFLESIKTLKKIQPMNKDTKNFIDSSNDFLTELNYRIEIWEQEQAVRKQEQAVKNARLNKIMQKVEENRRRNKMIRKHAEDLKVIFDYVDGK